ncbi:MAG TPA: hypothetical protein DF613_11075 [Lachnospiraceae bacterium]|nr:hypothetical protein [Lachnospiraceae bacterium]
MKQRQKTACLCIAALLLAGCAKSPEKDIVTRKNTEALVSKATEADGSRKPLAENKEQPPEHYSWNYDNSAGTLHIDVDTDVALPETDTIPMYRLSCTGFTQEQVTGLYDYLFQGRETFRREGESYTKADCEKDIVEARKHLEDIKQDTTERPEEEREQVIAYNQQFLDDLLAQYDTLPEESQEKKVPVDSTLVDQATTVMTEDGGSREEIAPGLTCESDEGDYFSVNNTPVESPGWPGLYYQKPGKYNYDQDIADPVTPQEADEKKSPELSYTYAEAKALADEAIASTGIDAELVQAGLLEGYTVINPEEKDNQETKGAGAYTAFQFQYARVIDGIPVATTASDYVSDDETALVWPYEKINVVVSEAGIQQINWDSPVSLDESVANDVPILPFDEAKAVFEELAPLSHEGKIEQHSDENCSVSMDVHVNQVRLSLMRVKNDGSKRQGLYVPAWIFYGTETTHWHYQDPGIDGDEPTTESTPWIVLAVNAVDGTVIDQVEGY